MKKLYDKTLKNITTVTNMNTKLSIQRQQKMDKYITLYEKTKTSLKIMNLISRRIRLMCMKTIKLKRILKQ